MNNKRFYLATWQKLMAYIYSIPQPLNIMRLSFRADISYVHLLKIINALEKKGLVIAQKSGRQRKVQLTKKGEALAKFCFVLSQVVKKGESKDAH